MENLTFYCRRCIKNGRIETMRWINLSDFVHHVQHSHHLHPVAATELSPAEAPE